MEPVKWEGLKPDWMLDNRATLAFVRSVTSYLALLLVACPGFDFQRVIS